MVLENINYFNFKNNIDEEKLKEIAKEIKKGKTIVFPTDTVFGLGTNGLDANAIKKIYKIKNRPLNKPMNLIVQDIDMVKSITKNISKEELKIMEAFLPGPLTIILNKKQIVPDILTNNKGTVGIRIPENKVLQKLIKYCGVPLVGTSANISGKNNGTNIKEIIKEFGNKVDYYIDCGESKVTKPSTIVRVIDKKIFILRQGEITLEQIENYKFTVENSCKKKCDMLEYKL